jgi:hypothetical protein
MPRTLRPAVAALSVLAGLALPATGSAAGQSAPDLRCDGIYGPGTYNNVIVPPNGTCTLSEVTVLGNVIVQHDGNLDLQGSGSIGQSLRAGNNSSVFEDFGWVVNGLTTADGATSLSLDGTLHNVALNNTQDANLFATTIDGNFVANHSTDSVGIQSTTKITGSVVLNDSGGGVPGFLNYYIDDNPEIDGSVIVTNNTAPVEIVGNVIRQNLACFGNNPPPVNGGNTVGGRSLGQCATPTPGAGA